jgi:short-subunit dehydrogenase
MEAVLPDMIRQGGGTIAGISSLAAWRGLPGAGAYCASKSALSTLLESARLDLRNTGVKIVTVCPGFVKSEITARRDPREMPFLLETEDGARRIIRGIKKQKSLVHFPWQVSWLMKLVKLLPDGLYDPLLARFGPRHRSRSIIP